MFFSLLSHLVALKYVQHSRPASVPAGGVDGALLRSNDKVVHVAVREAREKTFIETRSKKIVYVSTH